MPKFNPIAGAKISERTNAIEYNAPYLPCRDGGAMVNVKFNINGIANTSEKVIIMINKNMDQINLSEKADGVYYLVQQMGESKSIQRLIKFTKTK